MAVNYPAIYYCKQPIKNWKILAFLGQREMKNVQPHLALQQSMRQDYEPLCRIVADVKLNCCDNVKDSP